MKKILIGTLIISTMILTSCSTDPCEQVDNIECGTGDVDGDGVLNDVDSSPENPCLPNTASIACPDADTDADGVINSEDSAPEDPCIPMMTALVCATGDTDGDGLINVEDTAPEDPCVPSQNNLACPTGDVDGDGVSNEDDEAPDNSCIPDANVLTCPTGDFDNDGVPNGEDPNPINPCIPNAPPFVENVIGKWSWRLGFENGRVRINENGTYQDLSNALVSNGQVVKRNWTVDNGRMKFEVENSGGFKASINMKWKNYDCSSITFDGEGFGDLDFTRE